MLLILYLIFRVIAELRPVYLSLGSSKSNSTAHTSDSIDSTATIMRASDPLFSRPNLASIILQAVSQALLEHGTVMSEWTHLLSKKGVGGGAGGLYS